MNTEVCWYLQFEGKADGPYSLADLKGQIRQGRLQGHTLVFKEGAPEWKRAFDWPEIGHEIFNEEKSSFQQALGPARDSQKSKSDWVVLVRTDNSDGVRFKQEGPFTTEKVREMLQTKRLRPQDHVWRGGFEKWLPVYVCEEFSASLWNLRDESVPLLKEVVERPQGGTANQPELRVLPSDSEFEDERPPLHVIDASHGIKPRPDPELRVPTSEEKSQVTASRVVSSSPVAWSTYAVIGVVTICLGLVVWKRFPTSRWHLQVADSPQAEDVVAGETEQGSTSPEMTPETPENEEKPMGARAEPNAESTKAPVAVVTAPAKAKPESVVSQVKAPQTTTTAMAASAKPETVVLAEVPAATRKPAPWVLKVTGAVGSTVSVQITGASGKILDMPALTLNTDMKIEKPDRLEIDPQSLKLPEGQYRVAVFESGKLVDRMEKNLISDPDQFQKSLFAHRKQISYDQQVEKRNLLKTIDNLQKFLVAHRAELGKQLSGSAKTSLLKGLEAMNRPELKKLKKSRHQLMYPEGWTALAAQYDQTKSLLQATGARRPAAKQDLEVLRKKVTALRSQVSQTSLWQTE